MEVCLTYKGKNGNTRTLILEHALAHTHTHTCAPILTHSYIQTYTVLILLENRRKKRKKRAFNAEKRFSTVVDEFASAIIMECRY